jgi:putative transposase
LARRSARLWPAQDDLQSVCSLERLGVFNKIFAELAGKGGKPERIMIDATHLKAHRTAASLLKKGLFPDVSGAPKAA